MKDITQQFSDMANVRSHGTLSGIIKNNLNKQKTKKKKQHWAVTDISNPLQTYFKIKYPEKYKDSIETKKKFTLGNKQHAILQKKFELLEGFFDREIILDGRMLDINLIGRADAKVKNQIWEIKSKENLPLNKEELLEKYPQDVEQLCFYSLIDGESPSENVLIFTTHSDFNQIKAFKIKIKDPGKIKNLALNRMGKLEKWLELDTLPEIEFKCRYCDNDCSIKAEDICPFFDNVDLPCEIEDSIEITESPEIENQLKQIEIYEEDANYFYLFNLITPKKFIYDEFEDIEEEPFDNSYKKQNQKLIQNVLYEEKMLITNEELREIKKNQNIQNINQNRNSFIKLNLDSNEKIIPILIHVSDTKNPTSLFNPSTYKKGELGIHCFNNKTNKGYLISYFPEQDHEVRVFEISYNFEKETLNKIKNIAEIIKTKNKEKIKELPMCPNFMCRDCVYKEKCLS